MLHNQIFASPTSMLRSIVTRLIIALSLLIAVDGYAQKLAERPFVEYKGDVGEYLKRLHSEPGKLAWREDFPGGFAEWQTSCRAKLKTLLGLDKIAEHCKSHRPQVTLDKAIRKEDYLRQRGTIETEPGVNIPFWVLRPMKNPRQAKRPVVICAHGHDSNGWNTYAGNYTDTKHQQATLAKDGNPGVQAVKRGYIAIVPATRGLATAASVPDPKGRHGNRMCRAQLIHCLLAGRTPVGERVWDTLQLLDWITSDLPGADKSRIGMLGNSGGGVLTVYVAALDRRITIAHPSCSLTSFTSSTGFVFHCDCCLIPRVQVELADMTDIAALAAPRPLLVVHGRRDGLHSHPDVERAMTRIRDIYEAKNVGHQFRFQWGAAGHKFYPAFIWPFFDKYLQPDS